MTVAYAKLYEIIHKNVKDKRLMKYWIRKRG